MKRRHRWYCPICKEGVLGPAKPSRKTEAGHCKKCSDELGYRVNRVCPAVERLAQVREKRRKDRFKRRLEKLRIKTGIQIRADGKMPKVRVRRARGMNRLEQP